MSDPTPLDPSLADLEALQKEGETAFARAGDGEAIEAARIEFLGQKSGRLKSAQERLKTLEPSAKKAYGQRFNAAKQAIEAAFEAAKIRVERPSAIIDAIDVTLPGILPKLGHRHPLTQTADELIDLFGRFGFAVARGPEVEDVRHNFEALNIPLRTRLATRLTIFISAKTPYFGARPARSRSGSWRVSRRRSG